MLFLIKFPKETNLSPISKINSDNHHRPSITGHNHYLLVLLLFLLINNFNEVWGQRYHPFQSSISSSPSSFPPPSSRPSSTTSSSSSSSLSLSPSSLTSFLPSITTNLWNQLSTGNRRHDEQLEQGPLFFGGSFDFDLNELAHLIQPMYNLIKNSEIIKTDQGENRGGNSGNSGGNNNNNNNNNDQMMASASSRPGLTFSPSFGSGSTQIKPLITFAVPEIEFLNGNSNNNLNNNHNNQPNSHQFYNRLNGRPFHGGIDPYLASASGDPGPLAATNFNNANLNRGSSSFSTSTSNSSRRKKKRRPSSKSKRKPLIQIVDDEENDENNNGEEDEIDSLIPMSSNVNDNKNNNQGEDDEDDRKDSEENQALDQILEMGLPNFLLEEVFGLNRRLLKPGKILAHLTIGALARGMIKRFFKTFLARSMPERGSLFRRVADKSCRSVRGLSLRDSVILPLGVAVTLHPLLLPLMPFMLFTLGSLKAIESATCFVSHAFR